MKKILYSTKNIIDIIQDEIDWCNSFSGEWGEDYSSKERKAFVKGLERIVKIFREAEKQLDISKLSK